MCRVWDEIRRIVGEALNTRRSIKCFGETINGVFLRTEAFLLFMFELLGGFDPSMAQTKVLAGAVTESLFNGGCDVYQ